MSSEIVSLSPLDTTRFGIVSARASQISPENLHFILEFCSKNRVKFLIGRCSSSDIKTVHTMEDNGFRLMDTLVYLRKDLHGFSYLGVPEELVIRSLEPGDVPQVVNVARASFTGYKGHYNVDRRLDPEAAIEVYASWAERCCLNRSVADHVLVAEMNNEIVGFKAIRINSPQQTEVILVGVAPQARKKGIFRELMSQCLRWSREIDAKETIISTLLTNIPVQKACSQLNFTLYSSYHTFHKWFD